MSIERWSDEILVVALQDDPAFSDDVTALVEEVEGNHELDAVLNFAGVKYINSSNIAKLLKLRKKLVHHQRRLVLCGIQTKYLDITRPTASFVHATGENGALGQRRHPTGGFRLTS